MTTELLYNGAPVDVVGDLPDDELIVQYAYTDREFIISNDTIIVAADWE